MVDPIKAKFDIIQHNDQMHLFFRKSNKIGKIIPLDSTSKVSESTTVFKSAVKENITMDHENIEPTDEPGPSNAPVSSIQPRVFIQKLDMRRRATRDAISIFSGHSIGDGDANVDNHSCARKKKKTNDDEIDKKNEMGRSLHADKLDYGMKIQVAKLMKNNPALWDVSHKQHHNKIVTAKAWNAIAFDMKIPVEKVKTLWHSCLDTLQVHKKSKLPPSGSGIEDTEELECDDGEEFNDDDPPTRSKLNQPKKPEHEIQKPSLQFIEIWTHLDALFKQLSNLDAHLLGADFIKMTAEKLKKLKPKGT